jgi:hypothetical protein
MIQVGRTGTNELGINVDLRHVIDNDGEPHARAIVQEVTEKRCLACAEEPRKHCDWEAVVPSAG